MLDHESRLAGTAFSRTGSTAFARFLIRTSRRALGFAVLVNLVFRRTRLTAFRALVWANAHQRPPLQHNKSALAHAASADALLSAVPVTTPSKATRWAATSAPCVHLVGTLAFPSTSRAAFRTNAYQRLPRFNHKAGFADASFSSADLWASFWGSPSAGRRAQ